MPEHAERAARDASWWLAVAALALIGPWPGWRLPVAAAAAAAVVLLALARPWRDPRHRLPPWAAVALGLTLVGFGGGGPPAPGRLAAALDGHLGDMFETAREVAEEPTLRRLFAAPGKAADPRLPFEALEPRLHRVEGRTVYLADDRGDLVAWAGAPRAFPDGLRPIGPRRWQLGWTALVGQLVLREPVLVEGRMVGAVTVVDRAPLVTRSAWGMRAPPGRRLLLGAPAGTAPVWVEGELEPSLRVPVRLSPEVAVPPERWLPWLLLALLALAAAPSVAWVVVAAGGLSAMAAPGPPLPAAGGLLVLLAGAAVARSGRRLPGPAAVALVAAAVLALPVLAVVLRAHPVARWLPDHALRPGFGVLWIVALGLAVSILPALRGRRDLRLAPRLAVAALVALVGVGSEALRVRVELARAGDGMPALVPSGPLPISPLLPAPPGEVELEGLAARLAAIWDVPAWSVPATLRVVAADGREVSRWGNLEPAGEQRRLLRLIQLPDLAPAGGAVEVWTAAPPWAWLADWDPGEPLEAIRAEPVWFATLTRTGEVAATMHEGVRALEPERAGALFHEGGGWTLLEVGGEARLARVTRRGEWMVAAISHHPPASVWLLRTLLAALWAFVALGVALPPHLRVESFATFGGRLRLLVAGSVILPLVFLTAILNQRLAHEQVRLARARGADALRAARWTTQHLGGTFDVDDELAGWLAEQVDAEVVLFEGARPIAASRPDLLARGVVPELPAAAAFARHLVGRHEPVVTEEGGRLVAAAGVVVQDRRLLLELFPADPMRPTDLPGVADWLLAGAAAAGLLALMLTARVERRLTTSLREMVGLARRVHRGEPVTEVERPRETDLAEVVDAVRAMSEEVQRREQGLRHSEELLRVTLSTVSPAVLVLTTGGAIRFANPAAQELLDRHRAVVMERVRALAARRAGETSALETLQPFPGEDVTWRIGVAEAPFPDGTRGVIAVVDDVSEVVLVDRLRQLTQLARIVAHEVKNPLTPIRLWVQEIEEALRRGDPRRDELSAEACREIAEQVRRLEAMAGSFSNLVALERWDAEPVDARALVEDTCAGLAVLGRRGVELALEVPEAGTCRVMGDRQWLRRALGNLVKNSVDALGERPGRITVRAGCAGGRVVLEVEDTAGGVPEAQLPDLFSPQFSTTSGGSGLGLALVRHVVARAGGTVAARNEAAGLLVQIELPEAPETPAGA